MDSLVDVSTETEELATLARMLAYIRDSARQLDAAALEYCVEMAMNAVKNELKMRDATQAPPDEFQIVLRQLQ